MVGSTTRLFRVKNLWDDGLDYEFDYSERDLFGEEGEGVVDQVQTGFEDGEGAMRVGSEVPLVLGHEEGGDWFGDNGDEGDSTEAVVDGGDDSDRLGPDYNVFCRVEAMKAAYASQCYWGVMGREMVP